MELKDKVAIITGATSGIGEAIATHFARQGARLMIHGRDAGRGQDLAKRLSAHTPAYFVAGDLVVTTTTRALVDEAVARFGRLDIVVANAGILGLGTVTGMTEELWENTMEVNLNSVFRLLRHAIPVMSRNGGGNIIVNSSIAAFKTFPAHAAYCASKAAVAALTRQIALDYGPAIRANVICPGPVSTELLHASAIAFEDPGTAVQRAAGKSPLKRLGTPDDVANLAVFLASEKSLWITGSVFTIDGGVMLG